MTLKVELEDSRILQRPKGYYYWDQLLEHIGSPNVIFNGKLVSMLESNGFIMMVYVEVYNALLKELSEIFCLMND